MIALVDCNSFFCSVEKAFHPGLSGKPVVVLSSNDGCIVAITPEAKAVGLHRGDPIFKVQHIVKAYGVKVFSSNMRLYAAMSERVTNILRDSIAQVENYSIDESFCYLDGYEQYHNTEEMMREIAGRIKDYTDIPVSVGIAPTKTLAKVGSKFAKNYKGYRSVCMIDTDEKRRKALGMFDLSDIWGIGRSTLSELRYQGICTPLEFADKSESWVKSHLKVPGQRTWLELNGQPCIDTSEIKQKQSICTSRSFGHMVSDIGYMQEAIAEFAASCANKLRAQKSVATEVSVFISSNPFREDLPQYSSFSSLPLPVPTSDTLEITQMAHRVLAQLFRPGINYKRAGVILSGIQPASPIQLQLFDVVTNRHERSELMNAIDQINGKYGPHSIRLAAEGSAQSPWHVLCENRSQNYISDLNEILKVKI
ncbi:MAG: Y-family DNA polymerase [Bacteroidales bacterium]|nr:Y-family DNA polymerase [Candidatus Liminaster caballi]